MRELGSTIECYRGESFVVKREFVDENDEPLYIKPTVKNPFIRFTVSSNTHRIDGEYKKNYWLDQTERWRFTGYEQFANNEIPENTTELKEDVIYYLITDNGREYYLFDGKELQPYSFLIFKRFLNNDTKEWVGQIYQYEIALCAGRLTSDWLKEIFQTLYPDTSPPNANLELAHYICKKRPDLLKDVDINEPLISYTTNRVLQGPCKLIVKEN